MDAIEKKKEKGIQKISIMNWIGTLIICSIPGINILAFLTYAIFSKAQAKRSFAIASLILIILLAAVICAVFLIFPEQLAQLASSLRGSLPQAPAGNILVMD